MNWQSTTAAQTAETISKIMACCALFSIVLPTAVPVIFAALFLFFSIVAGNYEFKFQLIIKNSIALIAITIFLLFVLGLLYTSAPIDEALNSLKKYSKFLYIPLLLCAFYQPYWKRIGYIAFLSGVILMMLMSYLTLTGWSPESIYAGTYAGRDEHIVFRSRIAHGILVAFATYLFIHHAIENRRFRYVFVLLALLASFNVLVMVASRSGQILWVVLMLLVIYQHLGWKKVVLGFVIVPTLAITIMYSSEVTRTRMLELYDDVELIKQGNFANSLGLRIVWAQVGWEIFKDNPIFGTGTGSYQNEFNKLVQNQEVQHPAQYSTDNPHNGYVSVGVQLGLVGLILLAMLLIQQWRASKMLPKLYCYIAKGMVIAFVVGNCINSLIYSHTQGIFFMMLSALLFSSISSKHSDKV